MEKERRFISFNVRLKPEMWKFLKRASVEEERSMAAIIEDQVNEYQATYYPEEKQKYITKSPVAKKINTTTKKTQELIPEKNKSKIAQNKKVKPTRYDTII